jgi:hypothetical protein
MMTTMNVHDVTEVRVERYNHAINAIVFAFICSDEGRHETTAFGIKPAAAIKIMSILGTEKTRVYCNERLLTVDQYVEELAVREVLDKMGEGDAT